MSKDDASASANGSFGSDGAIGPMTGAAAEPMNTDPGSVTAVERKALAGARAHFGTHRAACARRRGSWFVTEHRLLMMRSYLYTLLSASVFNPLMYLIALGVGIGSYIDGQASESVLHGVSYLTYVGPALLASAAINAAFAETSFPVMGGFRWTREFFAMHATPLQPHQIANGVLIAATLRVVFTAGVFWLMLLLFGTMPASTAAVALPVAVVTGMGIGAMMAALAAHLTDDDGWFALINRMVIAPMFLFSGTFYPLEQMPRGLHWIGWISPLWHGTELGRWAAFGLEVGTARLLWHAGYLLAILVTGLLLVWRGFARRLEA